MYASWWDFKILRTGLKSREITSTSELNGLGRGTV